MEPLDLAEKTLAALLMEMRFDSLLGDDCYTVTAEQEAVAIPAIIALQAAGYLCDPRDIELAAYGEISERDEHFAPAGEPWQKLNSVLEEVFENHEVK